MKKLLNKFNKIPVIASGVALLLSVAYILAFQFKLKEIGVHLYNPIYSHIELLVALPIFYFSLSYLISILIQNWVGKSISKKAKIVCAVIALLFEITYIILTICIFAKISLDTSVYIFLVKCQFIQIIPGILLSIGTAKSVTT